MIQPLFIRVPDEDLPSFRLFSGPLFIFDTTSLFFRGINWKTNRHPYSKATTGSWTVRCSVFIM